MREEKSSLFSFVVFSYIIRNLLLRLYPVSNRKIFIGGQDINDLDLAKLRNSISYITQDNFLFSGTIKDNLRWGNKEATDEEIIEACKIAQADDFVGSFTEKYDTFIEQGGINEE